MKTQEEKYQLLLNTALAFTAKNRSIALTVIAGSPSPRCKYFMEGSPGCAIGRLIEDKELCRKLDECSNTGVDEDEIFSKLPADLQEYGPDFLRELQELHDEDNNWDIYGLTQEGMYDAVDIANDLLGAGSRFTQEYTQKNANKN